MLKFKTCNFTGIKYKRLRLLENLLNIHVIKKELFLGFYKSLFDSIIEFTHDHFRSLDCTAEIILILIIQNGYFDAHNKIHLQLFKMIFARNYIFVLNVYYYNSIITKNYVANFGVSNKYFNGYISGIINGLEKHGLKNIAYLVDLSQFTTNELKIMHLSNKINYNKFDELFPEIKKNVTWMVANYKIDDNSERVFHRLFSSSWDGNHKNYLLKLEEFENKYKCEDEEKSFST